MKIGIDIVEIERFTKYSDSPSFIRRVGKASEVLSLAGKHAAKEALIKAVTELDLTSVMSIEVLNDQYGAPYFKFSSELKSLPKRYKISVSISHDGNFAIAVVLVQKRLLGKLFHLLSRTHT
jgi:holo-[acyl-carrier protein] synthase